jgi:hypothetical protein
MGSRAFSGAEWGKIFLLGCQCREWQEQGVIPIPPSNKLVHLPLLFIVIEQIVDTIIEPLRVGCSVTLRKNACTGEGKPHLQEIVRNG